MWLAGVRHEVQYCGYQQADRFMWVDHPGVEYLFPELFGIEEIGVDGLVSFRVGLVVQQNIRVSVCDLLVVDIDDTRFGLRCGGVRDFVCLSLARQSGSDVDELAYALL